LTDVAVGPNGDIYVADGYSSDYIHRFDHHGRYLTSFGGKKEPYSFSTLHKLALDTRFSPPRFIATDRANNRIVSLSLNGDFLGVVAPREEDAIRASLLLQAEWTKSETLPDFDNIYDELPKRRAVSDQMTYNIGDIQAGLAKGRMRHKATYNFPFQDHAMIGPSCAVADVRSDRAVIWSGSQWPQGDRSDIAKMLGMPLDHVHLICKAASGSYGRRGCDDAAADAAIMSQIVGKPVRVQWMREDEHAWEPYGPAMITRVRAALDASGNVGGWDYGVWSNTHSTRPGKAGDLLAGGYVGKPFPPSPPRPLPLPDGGGDRNAIPLYKFPAARVTNHFIPEMPLRVSALRGLGAYMNVFSIESFMDELAAAAKADPVEFRLRQLDDPRARDVIRLAAERFGWKAYQKQNGRGRGFGFARYKNHAGYCAVAMEVQLERDLASYTSKADLDDLYAALDRYDDAEAAQVIVRRPCPRLVEFHHGLAQREDRRHAGSCLGHFVFFLARVERLGQRGASARNAAASKALGSSPVAVTRALQALTACSSAGHTWGSRKSQSRRTVVFDLPVSFAGATVLRAPASRNRACRVRFRFFNCARLRATAGALFARTAARTARGLTHAGSGRQAACGRYPFLKQIDSVPLLRA
jgi:hypothetical protein